MVRKLTEKYGLVRIPKQWIWFDEMSEPNKSLDDLKRQYELTMQRRATLTSQASSLMSFASIIDTIVIALLIGLVSSPDVVKLLNEHPNEDLIIWTILVAFIAYIGTLILALLAYWEPKWVIAPKMPPLNGNYFDAADVFVGTQTDYGDVKRAYQLIKATDFTQRINSNKYELLKFAFISLICGISLTCVVAITILHHAL
jgi:hypothetical protein